MTQQFRDDFPYFRHHPTMIYLDSAATAHKPEKVIEAIHSFYEKGYGTVHRAVYAAALESTEQYARARETVRAFIHAKKSSEIIFTRGTTDAINLLARAFGMRYVCPNDEVIISAMEHHSNIVPWQLMCKEKGAHLRVIPVQDNGELDVAALQRMLSEKTKIVAITHMSNVLGTINPIKEIAALVHQTKAKLFVDGAQSIVHELVDVQDLDVDFFAFSGHKLMGPTGIGVLYGKEDLLEELPPVTGGGDSITEVTFEETFFQKPPLRFEPGTPPIASAIGLGAAIEYINALGRKESYNYVHELYSHLEEHLLNIKGVAILGRAKNRSGLISFFVPGVHALDIAMLLDARNIAVRSGHLCAQPLLQRYNVTSVIRFSLGIYNTKKDLDSAAEALQSVISACM